MRICEKERKKLNPKKENQRRIRMRNESCVDSKKHTHRVRETLEKRKNLKIIFYFF